MYARVPHPLVFKGAVFDFSAACVFLMRNALRRFYGRGDLHFITFSCYRRRRYLGTPRARNRFVRILDQVRSRFRFLLIGYVVMPEHVHLMMSEPQKGDPSKVLQVLKQRVSRSLRKPAKKPSGQLLLVFEAATRARRFGSDASMTSMCGAAKSSKRN
jgi:REP element-mobilizing transposase RayT